MFHVKQNTRKKGKFAEDLVIYYLKQNNFKIVFRNYYCGHLELDIIATKNNYIYIIEVKSVSRETFEAELNMTEQKFKNILNCTLNFLHKQKIFPQKLLVYLFTVQYNIKNKKAKIKSYKLIEKSFT